MNAPVTPNCKVVSNSILFIPTSSFQGDGQLVDTTATGQQVDTAGRSAVAAAQRRNGAFAGLDLASVVNTLAARNAPINLNFIAEQNQYNRDRIETQYNNSNNDETPPWARRYFAKLHSAQRESFRRLENAFKTAQAKAAADLDARLNSGSIPPASSGGGAPTAASSQASPTHGPDTSDLWRQGCGPEKPSVFHFGWSPAPSRDAPASSQPVVETVSEKTDLPVQSFSDFQFGPPPASSAPTTQNPPGGFQLGEPASKMPPGSSAPGLPSAGFQCGEYPAFSASMQSRPPDVAMAKDPDATSGDEESVRKERRGAKQTPVPKRRMGPRACKKTAP